MPTLVTCSCGTKLRLPDQAAGKLFRCPRCKAALSVPEETAVLPSSPAPPPPAELRSLTLPARPEPPPPAELRSLTLPARPEPPPPAELRSLTLPARPEPPPSAPPARANGTAAGRTCPICQTAIEASEPVVTCSQCDQVHHAPCWMEVGGCSTYGCAQAPAVDKEAPAARPLTAWGDTKRCPACGETIKSIALRCRYCQTDFETVDPLTAQDLRKKARKKESLGSVQTTAVVLFVMSLTGLLAPLVLILSPFLIFPQRQLLSKSGPFYLVLGYSAFGLSTLYSILMVLFLLYSAMN